MLSKINTAGSTFSGELQTPLSIGFAKQKRKLPNLEKMYMTAFRHKLIHNSTTQSKTSKMAANGGNFPQLRAIITSHTVCTFKMVYCTVHAAALQQL